MAENLINVSSTTENSVSYTDTYTISLLSTTDDGREYQCEVVINSSPPVMTDDSVTLNVMSWLFYVDDISFNINANLIIMIV